MGEINLNDDFGKDIVNIVKAYNINNILEIGSWDGTGSTSCFIQAMKYFPKKKLVCIEPKKDRFDVLVKNANYDWVECINNSSISYNSFLNTNFEELWDAPYNKLVGHYDKELVRKWYQEDIELLKTIEHGYLELTPDATYAGVLIDGSEFMGYSEYNLLKDKTNFLFLDDCSKAFKTNRILNEVNDSPDWEVIVYRPDLRNGYAIVKRIELDLKRYL